MANTPYLDVALVILSTVCTRSFMTYLYLLTALLDVVKIGAMGELAYS